MKRSYVNILSCLCIGVILFGCDKYPAFEDTMLDSNIVFDPSLNNPEEFLVSSQFPNPTPEELAIPVIIAVHGYTASTFEWSEFREWSVASNSPHRISQVLLGGHGTTYEDFRASRWEDWAESIQLEYEKLEQLGYQNISLVGSSTGGTLLLELIRSGYFDNRLSPRNVFLVDPIIVASAKLQSVVGIIGPMLVFVEADQGTEEDAYWYHFRPQETLNELNQLMKKLRKGLEKGFSMPRGTYMKVFHSKHDPTANSLSSVLIYRGLKHSNGSPIDVQIMNSNIHVFTRLKLREAVTPLNIANQDDAFSQMTQRLNQ